MKRGPVRAYLGLGSNLGDRLANLKTGIEAISLLPDTVLDMVSPVYETAPWGLVDQPPFLNLCVAVGARLPPKALLDHILGIEAAIGRERKVRWGPRKLDIDILTYGGETIDEENLTVPHPRLLKRAFVLKPLLDIAPDLSIGGIELARALAELGEAGVMPYGTVDDL